jgi:gliding motility-associated-like protein
MIEFNMNIFNRYGQKVFEGKNGWDGNYNGKLADPGAYFYTIELPNGNIRKGTVEIIKVK